MISAPAIRHAVPTDATLIADLLGELGYSVHPSFFLERLAALPDQPSDAVFVAEQAENVIGFASIHLFAAFYADVRIGRITALVVSAHHRRHGIGRLLLDAAEAFAWERRCTQVEVTSGGTHEPAPQFYQSNGYADRAQHLVKARP